MKRKRFISKNITAIKKERLFNKRYNKKHRSLHQSLKIKKIIPIVYDFKAKRKRSVSKNILIIKNDRKYNTITQKKQRVRYHFNYKKILPDEKKSIKPLKMKKRKVKFSFHSFLLNIGYMIFIFPLLFLFSSRKIKSWPLRYFDRFLKLSFYMMLVALAGLGYIVTTGTNKLDLSLIHHKNDSFVYDKDRVLIGRISQNRARNEQVTNANYTQLSQTLVNSLVGTEDAMYFSHKGIDLLNTLENGFKSVILKSSSGGGSTITQQLIGETHLNKSNDRSIARKVREIYLAYLTDKEVSKEEVISSYLNYFGFGQENIHGIQLASNYFYMKEVASIDYAQSLVLIGTLNAPSNYNPLGGIDAEGKTVNKSQERYQQVLNANLNQGYVTSSEHALLKQVEIAKLVKIDNNILRNNYQAFIDAVAQEMKEKYGIDPSLNSLHIYTTMDRAKQDYANEITNMQHVNIEDPTLNFGFILTKTQTGEIQALSGGKQYRSTGSYLFNNALDNKQHPGSAFKPIIDYSPGYEYLHWNDSKTFSNAAYKYPNTGQVVNNVDNKTGGNFNVPQALAYSRNLPALRAMEEVYTSIGFNELGNYLNGLGFSFEKDEVVPAYGLGGLRNGVTPLEMNGALQTFGNGGYYIKPYTVLSFVGEDGVEIKNPTLPVRAIDSRTAYMTAVAMEKSTQVAGAYVNVANYWSTPYAAKTGTSNWDSSAYQYGIPNLAPKDAWFVGFTSEHTMSVWGGYDTAEILQGKYPGWHNGSHDYPGHVWSNFMTHFVNGNETSYLNQTPPAGLIGGYQGYGLNYVDKVGVGGYISIADYQITPTFRNNIINIKFDNYPYYNEQYVIVDGVTNLISNNTFSMPAGDKHEITYYYVVDGIEYNKRTLCYQNKAFLEQCTTP